MTLPKTTTLLEPAPVSPISTKPCFPQSMQSSIFANFLGSPSSSSSPQQQRSPTTLFKHDKRWRWWNFITIFTALLIIAQVIVLCNGYKDLLNQESSAIRIGNNKYEQLIVL
jgi:hypothetical protein